MPGIYGPTSPADDFIVDSFGVRGARGPGPTADELLAAVAGLLNLPGGVLGLDATGRVALAQMPLRWEQFYQALEVAQPGAVAALEAAVAASPDDGLNIAYRHGDYVAPGGAVWSCLQGLYPLVSLGAVAKAAGGYDLVGTPGLRQPALPASIADAMAGVRTDVWVTPAVMAATIKQAVQAAIAGTSGAMRVKVAVGAHAVLMFAADGGGAAVLADPTNPQYVFAGLTLAAGQPGDAVPVTELGLLTDASWTWTPRQPVFAAPGGTLTQAPPTTGFSHLVGYAASGTILMVAPQDPALIAT